MADAAFADLMASEADVRRVMNSRLKEGRVPSASLESKIAPPPSTVDVDAELKRLGLGATTAIPGTTAAIPKAAAAPRTAPAPPPPVPQQPLVTPAAKPDTTLSAVLASRKAQLRSAVHEDLLGLRGADDDSDDDDDCGDDEAADEDRVARTAAAAPPASLAREANLLADESAAVRKRAIASLQTMALTAEQLRPLVNPLLLRFADASEACRDGAVRLVAAWQAAASPAEVAGALPFLMPVMVERLGAETQTEPSEEVRVLLVALARDVVRACQRLLRPYLGDLGAIALGCCRDRHPEVLKAACALLRVACDAVLLPMSREGPGAGKTVKPFSTKLLEAVLPHARHRHHAVRLAVLDALQPLLLCGAGQSVETLVGWRLPNNVPIQEFYGKGEARRNYLAELQRDAHAPVRKKLMTVACRWISEMDPEDLYEQEVRLMPYVLSALFDADAPTAAAALVELERLGQKYVQTHEQDFVDTLEYGHAEEKAKEDALTLALPPPFSKRPSVGCRARVRQHFRALIHPIVKELQSWAAPERVLSAQLLEVLLVFVEEHATEFVHMLLPALAHASDADDAPLAAVAGRCAAKLAQHVPPEAYLPLAIDSLRQHALNPLGQRVQYATLVASLARGMRPAARAAAVPQLCAALAEEPTLCAQHTALRAAVRAGLRTIPPSTGGADASGGAFCRARLRALLLHQASAPSLVPKEVDLGDGVMEVQPAEEAAWAAAAAAARDDAAAVVATFGGGGGEGGGGPWATHAAALRADLHAAPLVAEYEVCATQAQHLLEILVAEGGAAPAPPKPPPKTAAAAPVDAPAPAPAAKKLAIQEVDDFDSDDVDEDDGAKPEEIDEFEDELD